MKAPKIIVTLTSHEYRFVIQSLIEIRNELIKDGKCSDIFNDLLIKIHKAKRRR